MTDTAVRRPPILTGACLYLGVLSAIIAIRAITVVSSWNAEGRATDFSMVLTALRDAGLSADGAETAYKILLTLVAVLAACAAVFAVYTSRGHRASRIGMTVAIGIAGTLTFLGALGGSFFFAMTGALVVVFTIRLWTGEIRTYFRTLAGHPPPPPKKPAPSVPAAAQAPVQAPVQTPVPAPAAPTFAQSAHQTGAARLAMPRSVAIATWTAFTGSLVAALGAGVVLLGLVLLGSSGYETMAKDSPFNGVMDRSSADYDQLYRQTVTILGISLALSVAGLAASVLVLVKKRSGQVFLFVMAVVTVPASFVLLPIAGLPWTAAAIVSLVQLRKPDAKAWFSPT